jgi:hypothetical protein
MKPLIKTILVLIAILAAVAFTVAQPAPDQSIKQTAFYQQVMDSLQVAGLGSSWLTNTNPPLTYDPSTFTVQGWTNTNALRFTNAIEIGGTRLTTNTNLAVLTYNTTNNAVFGPTNGDSLKLTNSLLLTVTNSAGQNVFAAILRRTPDDIAATNGVAILTIVQGDLSTGVLAQQPVFSVNSEGLTPNEAFVVYADGSAFFANPETTRTNLFGHGGITTNISVLVPGGGTNTLRFTNGILFSNSVP